MSVIKQSDEWLKENLEKCISAVMQDVAHYVLQTDLPISFLGIRIRKGRVYRIISITDFESIISKNIRSSVVCKSYIIKFIIKYLIQTKHITINHCCDCYELIVEYF